MLSFDEFKQNCTTSFFSSFSKLNDIVIFKGLDEKVELLKKLEYSCYKSENKLIEKDISLLKESLNGEEAFLNKLKELKYPMTILHDTKIEVNNDIIKFDFIIITPNAIYPIDCKQLLGEIEINKNMDFIRLIKNPEGKIIKRKSVDNPVNKLYKNSLILEKYLKDNDLAHFYPIKSFVVFVDKNSYILKDSSKKGISQYICSLDNIGNYLRELDKNYIEENKTLSKSINVQYKIAEFLYKNNIFL